MRVVYDTNVLVAIFARRGEILKFKQDVLVGRVVPVTSTFILSELETVLQRSFGLTRQRAKSHTKLLERIAEVVKVDKIEKVARDQDDDHVLAAALTGSAEFIVTLDKDLLVLGKYKDTQILNLVDFRAELQKNK